MTSVELANLEVATNDPGLDGAQPLSESFLMAQSQGSEPVPVDAGAGTSAPAAAAAPGALQVDEDGLSGATAVDMRSLRR